MSRLTLPRVVLFALASASAACGLYSDQLKRAETQYTQAHYEAAEVNLADMELHIGSLTNAERVRYDLARGMTSLRLEHRQTARHWLAMAREDARVEPATLNDAQRATIERLLVELDPLNPHPNPNVASALGGEMSGAPGASGSPAPASGTPSANPSDAPSAH